MISNVRTKISNIALVRIKFTDFGLIKIKLSFIKKWFPTIKIRQTFTGMEDKDDSTTDKKAILALDGPSSRSDFSMSISEIGHVSHLLLEPNEASRVSQLIDSTELQRT